MNVNFKTHFPWPGADGKPEETKFLDSILRCLIGSDTGAPSAFGGKRHTIRRVKTKPRFRAGMKLVLTTGGRFTPRPFCETECVSVQYLRMEASHYAGGLSLGIWTDDPPLNPLMNLERMGTLAANDGMNLEQFHKWFLLDVITHGPGTYELVHWTDLRY